MYLDNIFFKMKCRDLWNNWAEIQIIFHLSSCHIFIICKCMILPSSISIHSLFMLAVDCWIFFFKSLRSVSTVYLSHKIVLVRTAISSLSFPLVFTHNAKYNNAVWELECMLKKKKKQIIPFNLPLKQYSLEKDML